jgi:hypothetical protein
MPLSLLPTTVNLNDDKVVMSFYAKQSIIADGARTVGLQFGGAWGSMVHAQGAIQKATQMTFVVCPAFDGREWLERETLTLAQECLPAEEIANAFDIVSVHERLFESVGLVASLFPRPSKSCLICAAKWDHQAWRARLDQVRSFRGRAEFSR